MVFFFHSHGSFPGCMLKIDLWKRRFLLETTIFRGYVSFTECIFTKRFGIIPAPGLHMPTLCQARKKCLEASWRVTRSCMKHWKYIPAVFVGIYFPYNWRRVPNLLIYFKENRGVQVMVSPKTEVRNSGHTKYVAHGIFESFVHSKSHIFKWYPLMFLWSLGFPAMKPFGHVLPLLPVLVREMLVDYLSSVCGFTFEWSASQLMKKEPWFCIFIYTQWLHICILYIHISCHVLSFMLPTTH